MRLMRPETSSEQRLRGFIFISHLILLLLGDTFNQAAEVYLHRSFHEYRWKSKNYFFKAFVL